MAFIQKSIQYIIDNESVLVCTSQIFNCVSPRILHVSLNFIPVLLLSPTIYFTRDLIIEYVKSTGCTCKTSRHGTSEDDDGDSDTDENYYCNSCIKRDSLYVKFFNHIDNLRSLLIKTLMGKKVSRKIMKIRTLEKLFFDKFKYYKHPSNKVKYCSPIGICDYSESFMNSNNQEYKFKMMYSMIKRSTETKYFDIMTEIHNLYLPIVPRNNIDMLKFIIERYKKDDGFFRSSISSSLEYHDIVANWILWFYFNSDVEDPIKVFCSLKSRDSDQLLVRLISEIKDSKTVADIIEPYKISFLGLVARDRIKEIYDYYPFMLQDTKFSEIYQWWKNYNYKDYFIERLEEIKSENILSVYLANIQDAETAITLISMGANPEYVSFFLLAENAYFIETYNFQVTKRILNCYLSRLRNDSEINPVYFRNYEGNYNEIIRNLFSWREITECKKIASLKEICRGKFKINEETDRNVIRRLLECKFPVCGMHENDELLEIENVLPVCEIGFKINNKYIEKCIAKYDPLSEKEETKKIKKYLN